MDTVTVSGWQVVQERDGLRMLLSGAQNGVHDDTLRTTLQQTLAEQGVIVPSIEIQHVASIPRNASGKAQQIVPYVPDTSTGLPA